MKFTGTQKIYIILGVLLLVFLVWSWILMREEILKMTIVIHWWYLPIILFIWPFFVLPFYKGSGGYFDFGPIGTMILAFISWAAAIGIIIGHFV